MFRETQIGVVHFGEQPSGSAKCANEFPGKFMRVTHYKEWIMEHTDETTQDSNCETDS